MKEKKKKKKKWLPLVIILVIIIGIVVSFVQCSKKATEMLFEEDEVAVRDIQNYHSFNGTISAKNEQVIYPEVAAKVKEVKVKKGDQVKKGDVIMVLDSKDAVDSIAELEISMSINQISNSLNVQEANTTYNNYINNIINNNNSNLNSASQQVESSLETWVIAKQNYDNEVMLNQKGYSQNLMSATADIDRAYNNLLSAQASYDQEFSSEYYNEYARTQVTASRENAEINYEMAIKSYEAAKINEDITLTKLYDNVLQAQNGYYTAIKNYETTKVQVLQQADLYKFNVTKAQANSNQTLNELKLGRLYSELNKYEIKATRDGIISSLELKEGDFSTIGKSVATITDYDVLQVEIKINEYDIGKVDIGSKVEVYINSLERSVEGEIVYIDKTATVDNGVSYFKAEVNFNGEEDIRCGMSTEVRIYTVKKDSVLSIPSEAVQVKEDGTAFVWIKDSDGKQVEQTIETGISDGIYIEVLDGLTEGQKIVYMPSMFDAMQLEVEAE